MVCRMHGKRRQNEHPHTEKRKLMQLDASDQRLLFKEQGPSYETAVCKRLIQVSIFLSFLVPAWHQKTAQGMHGPTHLKAICVMTLGDSSNAWIVCRHRPS